MKRWFKRGLFGFVVIFMVAVIGAAVFLLTFDPNAYKEKLQSYVYERYQRTLSINGDIKLSLFPRIGLELSEVSLSDRQSESRFASFDQARFAVAIWPLLSNHYVIDHVAVDGFQVHLTRNDNGQFNFSDLFSAAVLNNTAEQLSPAATVPSSSLRSLLPIAPVLAADNKAGQGVASERTPAKLQIDIAGLDLQGGYISYEDHYNAVQLALTEVQIGTGRVSFGQPFDVQLNAQVEGVKPSTAATLQAQTVLRFDPYVQHYAAQKIAIVLEGDIAGYSSSSTLKGDLRYQGDAGLIELKQVELSSKGERTNNGNTQKLQLTLNVPELQHSQHEEYFALRKLSLRAKSEHSDHKWEAALDAPKLLLDAQSVQAETIQGSWKSSGDTTWGVNLRIADFQGTIDAFSADTTTIEGVWKRPNQAWQLRLHSALAWQRQHDQLQWRDVQGQLRLEDEGLEEGHVALQLEGSALWQLRERMWQLQSVASSGETGVVRSQLQYDYHAPKPTLNFMLHAQDADFSSWIPSQHVRAQRRGTSLASAQLRPVLVGPEVGPAFNWSVLGNMNATGSIQLVQSRIGRFDFEGFKADVDVQDGKLHAKLNSPRFYEGSLVGDVQLTQQNHMRANLDAYGVAMQPLLQSIWGEALLSGKGDISLRVNTQGYFYPQWLAQAKGRLNVDITDGEVNGLNSYQALESIVDVAKNAYSPQLPPLQTAFKRDASTPFAALSLQSVIDQGKLTVNAFSALSSRLRVNVEAPTYMQLGSGDTHLRLLLRLLRKQENTQNPNLAPLVNVAVPVLVHGPWRHPTYQVDWESIEAPVVRQALGNELLSKLSATSTIEELIVTEGGAKTTPLLKKETATQGIAPRSLRQAVVDLFER